MIPGKTTPVKTNLKLRHNHRRYWSSATGTDASFQRRRTRPEDQPRQAAPPPTGLERAPGVFGA